MRRHAEEIIRLYQRHGRAWSQLREQGLMERVWLDRFLDLMPDKPACLDLGCGTGQPLAGYLIRRGCAVTGVDTAPDLVAMAQEALPQGHWQVGDMRALSLGQRFHGLLAWHSFFHLTPDDQRAMFATFQAHAASGAALMFTSGAEAGEAMGTFGGEALYHGSLCPAEYRQLLGAHGFEVIAHVVEDAACGGATVWLARSE